MPFADAAAALQPAVYSLMNFAVNPATHPCINSDKGLHQHCFFSFILTQILPENDATVYDANGHSVCKSRGIGGHATQLQKVVEDI